MPKRFIATAEQLRAVGLRLVSSGDYAVLQHYSRRTIQRQCQHKSIAYLAGGKVFYPFKVGGDWRIPVPINE